VDNAPTRTTDFALSALETNWNRENIREWNEIRPNFRLVYKQITTKIAVEVDEKVMVLYAIIRWMIIENLESYAKWSYFLYYKCKVILCYKINR